MARMKDKGKMAIIIGVMIIVLVSSVVFAAGPGGGGAGGPGGGPGGRGGNMGAVEMSESVINVKLQTPEIGSLSRDTEFIGKIEPSETVNVYPEVSSKVTKIYVEAGDTVEAGQLLFEMDDSDAQLSYQQAQLSYESTQVSTSTNLGSSYDSRIISAESSLKNAQQSLNSARQNLRDYNDGYQDDLVRAESARDKAYEEYMAAQQAYDAIEDKQSEEGKAAWAALDEAEGKYTLARGDVVDLENDEDTEARSLRNAYRNAQNSYETALKNYQLATGLSYEDAEAAAEVQLKSANLTLEQRAKDLSKYKIYAPIGGVIESKNVSLYESPGMQSAAYTISNKEMMSVSFNATADGAAALSLGDTITVTKGGKDYQATIFEIDTKANESTGLFPVKAQLEQVDGSILSGVTVKVTASTAKAEDAMLIPVDLIYYDEGQAYVYTYQDGKAVRTDIETGMSTSETTVVESGLTKDSLLITTWHPDLADGVSVNLAEGVTLPEGMQTPSTDSQQQGGPATMPADGAPEGQPDAVDPSDAPAEQPETAAEQGATPQPQGQEG